MPKFDDFLKVNHKADDFDIWDLSHLDLKNCHIKLVLPWQQNSTWQPWSHTPRKRSIYPWEPYPPEIRNKLLHSSEIAKILMMLIVANQVWGTRGVLSRETAMKRFVGVAKACCVNFLRTENLHIAARLLCDCITFHFSGLWNRRFSIRSHTHLLLAFLTLIAERCGYWTPGFITVYPTNERIFGRDPPSVITIYNPSCAVGSVYTK